MMHSARPTLAPDPTPIVPIPASPPQVLLTLSFDADQQGSDLSHTISRDGDDPANPNPTQGPYADSLYFAPGEQLNLQIVGSGSIAPAVARARSYDSFQVIDCAITTRPQVVQRGDGLSTLFAAPSPFLQSLGACYPLPLDFQAALVATAVEAERVVVQTWKRTLDVGMSPGLWDLAVTLTVRIKRGRGAVDEIRVFSFDPETEVGSTGTLS